MKRDGAGEKESCRVEGKCARGRWNSNELSESENCEGSQLMSTLEEGRNGGEWKRSRQVSANFEWGMTLLSLLISLSLEK